jgi:hypothetical protein
LVPLVAGLIGGIGGGVATQIVDEMYSGQHRISVISSAEPGFPVIGNIPGDEFIVAAPTSLLVENSGDFAETNVLITIDMVSAGGFDSLREPTIGRGPGLISNVSSRNWTVDEPEYKQYQIELERMDPGQRLLVQMHLNHPPDAYISVSSDDIAVRASRR